MPYIITIKTIVSRDQIVHPQLVSRHAVATIEEAREVCRNIALGVNAPGTGLRVGGIHPDVREVMWNVELKPQIARLTEAGGTIGPLPDSTTIEILQISYGSLASAFAFNAQALDSVGDQSQIITAFNEAQMPS